LLPSVASLVTAVESHEPRAVEALFAALYKDLRRVANRELGRLGQGATISPTTVLHEAYLDMAARDGVAFPDRPRFLRYASRVMRGLIIDHARSRHALKRGGGIEITALDNDLHGAEIDSREAERLAAIGVALDRLGESDPALAEVVDLKFFCGFSFVEIAEAQGIAERTVQRRWEKARLFLHHTLGAAALE
jgi:RNA polymerase sigma factor (TIGR02999 family)